MSNNKFYYHKVPRRRGTPDYKRMSRPREYLKSRCDNANNNLDRVVMYMGEMIEQFAEQSGTDLEAVEAIKSVLDEDDNQILGRYDKYIQQCALIMDSALALQQNVQHLKRQI